MNGLNTQDKASLNVRASTVEPNGGCIRRLDGWKEIASYLGRSARCAQRWERNLGLPVHRIRHTDGSTVYAYVEELELWRVSRDHIPPPATELAAASEAGDAKYRHSAPATHWNRSIFDLYRLVLRAVPVRIDRS